MEETPPHSGAAATAQDVSGHLGTSKHSQPGPGAGRRSCWHLGGPWVRRGQPPSVGAGGVGPTGLRAGRRAKPPQFRHTPPAWEAAGGHTPPAGNTWVRTAGSPAASGGFAGRALVKPEGTMFPRAARPERGHRGCCPPPAKSAIVLHLTPLPPPVHVKALPRGRGFIGLWRPLLRCGQSCAFREGLFLLVVFCYLFCF